MNRIPRDGARDAAPRYAAIIVVVDQPVLCREDKLHSVAAAALGDAVGWIPPQGNRISDLPVQRSVECRKCSDHKGPPFSTKLVISYTGATLPQDIQKERPELNLPNAVALPDQRAWSAGNLDATSTTSQPRNCRPALCAAANTE